MIVYFDTSALLKRYVVEADSEAVTVLWKNASTIAASQILYAELAAAFNRYTDSLLASGPFVLPFESDEANTPIPIDEAAALGARL